ncbi:hypothetical protein BASA81_004749 [Batrachochytrium salamandrivorans]|nr:hypothetical protein BASA81_004749 [Batrachochytrium salamandrivorans]
MNFMKQQVLRAKEPVREMELMYQNVRLRSAARKEYLQSRFKVPANAKEQLLDFDRAPSWQDTLDVFPELANCKVGGSASQVRLELLSARLGELREWSLEEVLEGCGCFVSGTGAFNLFCEQLGVFDLWQSEYVELLAQHLQMRGKRRVLEVGAGNGRLTNLLRLRLLECELIATDSGGWRKMPGLLGGIEVKRLGFEKALEVYQPDIVLCSWMPMHEDWTKAFRKHPSVCEYVLIGDPDCTGRGRETWNNSPGFAKRELNALSARQVCRHDRLPQRGHSQTASFVRM